MSWLVYASDSADNNWGAATQRPEQNLDRAAQGKLAALRNARLAWETAPRRCPEAEIGCQSYHRIRPFLRWLGLASEPEDQRAFLLPALVAALSGAGARVLVSGSTDEAMAAMVAEAGTTAGREPNITVLDRCPTPLLVNKAFAEATGTTVATVQADILAYRSSDRFDVIVTHSFLGQFAPAERSHLLANWFGLLGIGGRVATVARLRPAGETRSYSGEAADRLAAEVLRRATEHAQEIAVSPEQLAEAAFDYAIRRPVSFPVYSLDELIGLFRGAGFRILHAKECEALPRVTHIEGPGLPRGGTYAEIVAERR